MTRGTTLRKHNRGRAQHLQLSPFHVNIVFHCDDVIGPATSMTTWQSLHLQLGQTDTLRWRAEVQRPLRCGDATRTNRQSLQQPLRHLPRATQGIRLFEILTGCCSRLGILGCASEHALHAQGLDTGVQQDCQTDLSP